MPPERSAPDTPVAWVERARSDLRIAQAVIPGALNEDLCYHAQQCAEKALKAILLKHAGEFPYIHDVSELLNRVLQLGLEVPEHVLKASELTSFAVEARYPGFDDPLSDDELRDAIQIATQTLEWAETIVLG